MDTCLKPQVFDTAANAVDSSRKWKHWKRTFVSYTERITNVTAADKLAILRIHRYMRILANARRTTMPYASWMMPISNAWMKCMLGTNWALVDKLSASHWKKIFKDWRFSVPIVILGMLQLHSVKRQRFEMHSSYIRQRLLEGNDLQLPLCMIRHEC